MSFHSRCNVSVTLRTVRVAGVPFYCDIGKQLTQCTSRRSLYFRICRISMKETSVLQTPWMWIIRRWQTTSTVSSNSKLLNMDLYLMVQPLLRVIITKSTWYRILTQHATQIYFIFLYFLVPVGVDGVIFFLHIFYCIQAAFS